jgi:hypothetical protein
MIDQCRPPSLVLGVKNPAIVARDEKARSRWEAKNREFDRLNAQPHLATIAHLKVMRSLSFVQSALSQTERNQRFRNMYSYQDEILDLAPADSEMLIASFKLSSPIFIEQKERSLKDRVKIGDSEKPLRQHVLELISKHERRHEAAAELWPHFICLLREQGCQPKELMDAKRRIIGVEYDFDRSKNKRSFAGEPIRRMSFRTFRNLVSELRRSR